jgi:FAD/FMN-containing dehydrogenase
MKLSSWGRLSCQDYLTKSLSREVRNSPSLKLTTGETGIVYGMGRSYGDVCLNPGGIVLLSRNLDRLCSFDPISGELVCEAGVLLKDIQSLFVPRGWMLPVSPGTQYVTVGGAVANDIHGKNHHLQGCFANHVNWIRLARTEAEDIVCSHDTEAEWFNATCGGLGLTGVIKEVSLRLRKVSSCWLDTETLVYSSLAEFLQLSEESQERWEYTVSWVDCSSHRHHRGIFVRANHCQTDPRSKTHNGTVSMPIVPPIPLVNRLTLRAFNELYFGAQKMKSGLNKSHYKNFFYPLDSILNWNRMYGPRGFYQYQLVVPHLSGLPAIETILSEIALSRQGSFLSILKAFGDTPSPGLLSFPMEGITLALDFPNKGKSTLQLFHRLDAIVAEAGGRLYPAKDSRMPPALFASGYPRLPDFLPYRDPGLSSGFSQRLMGW